MRHQDHEYWESVHNTHVNERAFILASGPSLASCSILPRLQGHFVVGCAQLYRWPPAQKIDFSAWSVGEHRDLVAINEQIDSLDVPRWLGNAQWHYWNSVHPGFSLDSRWRWVQCDNSINWAGFPEKWTDRPEMLGLGETFDMIGNGHSPILQPAVPALAWMGFREIYLLGVDHTEEDHVYERDGLRAQAVVTANIAFEHMMGELSKRGVMLFNCSPKNNTPLPYRHIEEVLDEEGL